MNFLTSRPLLIRWVSAVLFGFMLLGSGYFGGPNGLAIISTIAILLGIAEYSKIAFARFDVPPFFVWVFIASSLVLYAALVHWEGRGLLSFAVTTSLFLASSLWLTRNNLPNEKLLPALGMGSLGMLYCVSLPVYAVHLVYLPKGPMWFLFLMIVVFAGDTFAFFGGRYFGSRKLMPHISPNKTVEGSIAGLLGSCLCGVLFVYVVFPATPMWRAFLFAALCGFVGQSGDLLMSLVKRVAQVKDSGYIMPGHGGVLDRLDGIFLSAPLVYAFAIS